MVSYYSGASGEEEAARLNEPVFFARIDQSHIPSWPVASQTFAVVGFRKVAKLFFMPLLINLT